uniref:Uncharacterized protein n=1 Tax=Takifugu rubripes TaxID=31033 RepID=A0A674NGU3_TAKRU
FKITGKKKMMLSSNLCQKMTQQIIMCVLSCSDKDSVLPAQTWLLPSLKKTLVWEFYHQMTTPFRNANC